MERTIAKVIVTGRLINGQREAKTVKSARRMVDRLDLQYGAAAHSYRIIWTEE